MYVQNDPAVHSLKNKWMIVNGRIWVHKVKGLYLLRKLHFESLLSPTAITAEPLSLMQYLILNSLPHHKIQDLFKVEMWPLQQFFSEHEKNKTVTGENA